MKELSIQCPRASLVEKDGELLIRHNKMAVEIPTSRTALDSWLMARMREALAAPASVDEKAGKV